VMPDRHASRVIMNEALGQLVDVIQSSVGTFFGLLILLVVSTSKSW